MSSQATYFRLALDALLARQCRLVAPLLLLRGPVGILGAVRAASFLVIVVIMFRLGDDDGRILRRCVECAG